MEGILIIDKPEGLTSHDVVARSRRILRTKRIGHTGTLDPFATGVMVVLVGRATRLAQFLDKDEKEYLALVRFGFETDTGDRTGAPRETAPDDGESVITKEAVETALRSFRGEILQTPPMYSAKKIEGKKLYELARKGVEVERKAVPVKIHELETIGQAAHFTDSTAVAEGRKPETEDLALRVVCSAGTYIRVLAEEIGREIGSRAHLAELRRTRAGKFGIENAFTLEELERAAADGRIEDRFISMNEAVSHLTEVVLSAEDAARVKNGVRLRKELENSKSGDFLRLTENGDLLAIGIYDGAEKTVQPKLVLV